jgi:hypothetical protein
MRKLSLAVLMVVLSGCASMRGVDVGGDDTARPFAVEVTNNRSGTITVFYSTGTQRVELGTVTARMTERYVVPVTDGSTVTIMAYTAGGGSAGNYPVAAEAGTTRRIIVR